MNSIIRLEPVLEGVKLEGENNIVIIINKICGNEKLREVNQTRTAGEMRNGESE